MNLHKPYRERDPELDPVVTSIPADILVQSPVMEEMECPALTSLPTSVLVVETLLSKADGQLTSTQTDDLTALLGEFGDVFSDVPLRTTLGVHHIELKPDTKPICCTPYCLNQEKAKVLKVELDNLLDQAIIQESTSPWASPTVMVLKADGTLRLCTDFRKVNNCTVPDPFPLPRIEDLIDRVGKAKYLTKLDMT